MNWVIYAVLLGIILVMVVLIFGCTVADFFSTDKKEKTDEPIRVTGKVKIEIVITDLTESQKTEREKKPFEPRDLRGIHFYCYDDCVPVLAPHLKEGEEPIVMHFGNPFDDEEPSSEIVDDNSDGRNECGNTRNDNSGKT